MYSISNVSRFQFFVVLAAFMFFVGCASEDLAKKSSDGSSSASSMKSKMKISEGGGGGNGSGQVIAIPKLRSKQIPSNT